MCSSGSSQTLADQVFPMDVRRRRHCPLPFQNGGDGRCLFITVWR